MSTRGSKKLSVQSLPRRPRSRSPNPDPQIQPANSPQAPPVHLSTNAVPLQTQSAQPPTPTANPILQKEIQSHIDNLLSDVEKQSFCNADTNISLEDLLQKTRNLDTSHQNASKWRGKADSLSRFFGLLDRFMKGTAISIQGAPSMASIIVGAIKTIIDLSFSFLNAFGRLSEMISQLGDFLEPLQHLDSCSNPLMQETLVNVYADIIMFCQRARAVFVDPGGNKREFVSWTSFWRIQWVPFEETFGKVMANFQHHLQVLGNSTQASLLSQSMQLLTEEQEKERIEFLNWISNNIFEDAHESKYSQKHEGTGDWLTMHPKFEAWVNSSASSLLWVHGKPGIGKSVLAANVLEQIMENHTLEKKTGICFAYYSYEDSDSVQELPNTILAFMKQICRKKSIPEDFLKQKADSYPPSVLGKKDTFKRLIEDLDNVFIVIDALDECKQSDRPDILGFITDLMTITRPTIKVFVTSRREQDILETFQGSQTPTIEIETGNVQSDIKKYVEDQMVKLQNGIPEKDFYIKSDDLQQKIVNTLINKADGMFLWVQLQLASLCDISRSRKDEELEKALERMPSGLEKTYSRILDSIDKQPDHLRQLAFKTLSWMIYAARPLLVYELQFIVQLDEANANSRVIVEEIDNILGACGNLLYVDNNTRRDEKAVHLIHFSVQEYLTSAALKLSPNHCLSLLNQATVIHSNLANSCLFYLLSNTWQQQIKDLRAHPRDSIYIFESYSPRYLDFHLSSAGPEYKNCLNSCRLLFALDNSRIGEILLMKESWQSIYATVNFEDYVSSVNPRSLTFAIPFFRRVPELEIFWSQYPIPKLALHEACRADSVATVEELLKQSYDISLKDGNGETGLYISASKGHLACTSALVANGADINAQVGELGNVLQAASLGGHLNVVQLLLQQGADVNAQGRYFRNALQAASLEGHFNVVQLLLQQGADVNTQGGEFGNALYAASWRGYLNVVQLLLQQGADVNAQGGYYGNALQAASNYGDLNVVQLLLQQGANVNARGGFYGNALYAASWEGHFNVVQLLLQQGADVNAQGGHYGNALNAALYWPRREILELLLSYGADDPEGVGKKALRQRAML